jgi:hypothetical protein
VTTMTKTFEVRAIQPVIVRDLLDCDDAGRRRHRVVDEVGGSPLRCCLRPIHPGEAVALVSYAPLRRWALETGIDPGPYDEVGPIFIHANGCAGYAGDGYPDLLRGPRRMMRAYRADGTIAAGRLVEPDEQPEEILAALFAGPDIAVVHARALEFGCFTFEIRRWSSR